MTPTTIEEFESLLMQEVIVVCKDGRSFSGLASSLFLVRLGNEIGIDTLTDDDEIKSICKSEIASITIA